MLILSYHAGQGEECATHVLFFHCHRFASLLCLLGLVTGMEGRVDKGTLLTWLVHMNVKVDLNLLICFLGLQHVCDGLFEWRSGNEVFGDELSANAAHAASKA